MTPDPDNAPFFAAAREGILLLGLCHDTGRAFFHPRGVSPFTLTTNVGTVAAGGAGTVHSVTVMRGAAPRTLAYVELAEGPRVFTEIVDAEPGTVRIGDPVRLAFRDVGGGPMPVFAPA